MKKITNLPVHEEGEVVTCSKEFIMWNKIQELTDAHNELAKIVGLLLKRDEENCLEKAKAELLETHTVKEVCICYQLSRHSKDPEMFCSCQCHGTKEEPTWVKGQKSVLCSQPTTPSNSEKEECTEKKCTDYACYMNYGKWTHYCGKKENETCQPTTPEKKLTTSSYEVTCGRCEKSIKHSCGRVA